MKRIKKFNKICPILLSILFFALTFSLGAYAKAASYPVVFETSNVKTGIVSRDIYLWKVDNELMEAESPEKFIEKLRGMELSELKEFFKREPIQLRGNSSDGFVIRTNLEEGCYVGLDVLKADSTYKAFLSFKVPDNTKNPISSKLELEENPGTGKLKKVDEKGRALAGVGFELYFSTDHPLNTTGELLGVPTNESGTRYDKNGTFKVLYTDKDGYIRVEGLEPGVYVFKEVKPLKGYRAEKREFTIVIRAGKETTITVINKKDGGFNFIKVSSKNSDPLKGAKFVVTKLVDGSYVRVQRNGEDIILTSGEDGKFSVDGLEFGDYYLWEIEAPKGYKKLKDPIKFTVGEESSTKILFIKNDELPPPPPPDNPPENPPEKPPKRPPEIPKTGDVAFIAMCISGLILIAMGLSLVRDKKEIV